MSSFDDAELDIYAEQGVIAGLLTDPATIPDVAGFLNERHFNEPRHAKIFASILTVQVTGSAVTLVSVGNSLREGGHLAEIGGIDYLSTLTDAEAPFAADADPVTYAMIVLEEFNKRELVRISRQVALDAKLDSGKSSEEILADSQALLRTLSESIVTKSSSANLTDMFDDFTVKIHERSLTEGAVNGIPTGFIDLDKVTNGFHPGQMVIVAARPGVGKSTLAVDFLRAASFKAKKVVMIFSLEMSREEIMDRIIAAESNVLLNTIKSGMLSDSQWASINEARARIAECTFILDDTPNMTMEYIRTATLKQKQTPEGVDEVVIDYLQLLRSGGRVESRQQEVSEFSRSGKLLAKEAGVCVIALSQLNRGPENRADGKPALSDLRESGSLEQDADIVLLIYKAEAEAGNPGRTILIVAKNRNGEQGAHIPLAPLLEYAKFANGSGTFPTEESYGDEEGLPRDEEVSGAAQFVDPAPEASQGAPRFNDPVDRLADAPPEVIPEAPEVDTSRPSPLFASRHDQPRSSHSRLPSIQRDDDLGSPFDEPPLEDLDDVLTGVATTRPLAPTPPPPPEHPPAWD